MATLMQTMAAELEHESQATRKLLERIPADKGDWTPHPRAMPLGQLAIHVAKIPGAIAKLTAEGVWDMAARPPKAPDPVSHDELLKAFDDSLADAMTTLRGITDQQAGETFTMKNGEKIIMQMPRAGIVRYILLNHLYHHRGQLSTYLRILDVKLPSVYGPSADENPFAG
ncbi:MAG: DinB family protein [Phycisphaerales bacterium]